MTLHFSKWYVLKDIEGKTFESKNILYQKYWEKNIYINVVFHYQKKT